MMEKIKFTTSKEIDAFSVGDNTICIKGFIDTVEGTKYVGVNKDTPLLKFALNNDDGRRIKILIWKDLVKLWESKIVTREIVSIERGRFLRMHPSFIQSEPGLIPFEIHFNKLYSNIKLLGKYKNDKDINDLHVTPTTIKDCVNSNGKISVEGFIKLPFMQITSNNINTTGNGVIANDIYRLKVEINNFKNRSELILGAHVLITGELKQDIKYESIPYLQVQDMNDIKLLDKELLTEEDLDKAINTPIKRSLPEDFSFVEDFANEQAHKKFCENINDSGIFSELELTDGKELNKENEHKNKKKH